MAVVDGGGGVDCSTQSHEMVLRTHDASKNSALQGETRSGASDAFCIERHGESCSASGARILASLDALWLLLHTGGRRCSASAVRLSARREPGQRGHEASAVPDFCLRCEPFFHARRRILLSLSGKYTFFTQDEDLLKKGYTCIVSQDSPLTAFKQGVPARTFKTLECCM